MQRPVLIGSAKVRETFYSASFGRKNFSVFALSCLRWPPVEARCKGKKFFRLSKLKGEIFEVSRFVLAVVPASIKLAFDVQLLVNYTADARYFTYPALFGSAKVVIFPHFPNARRKNFFFNLFFGDSNEPFLEWGAKVR